MLRPRNLDADDGAVCLEDFKFEIGRHQHAPYQQSIIEIIFYIQHTSHQAAPRTGSAGMNCSHMDEQVLDIYHHFIIRAVESLAT
jgi:hypothetical protein